MSLVQPLVINYIILCFTIAGWFDEFRDKSSKPSFDYFLFEQNTNIDSKTENYKVTNAAFSTYDVTSTCNCSWLEKSMYPRTFWYN